MRARSRRPGLARAGFTLIEAVIAMGLLSVVLVKLTLVIREAQTSHRREISTMDLEDRARRVLDQISFAVIGADRESLDPDPVAPLWTSRIDYNLSLGVEDGETVWGDPESIRLSNDDQQVLWMRNVGQPDERFVVWCRSVRALLERELANTQDDNENGVIDEKGLSFVMDGNSIIIRLTLEREGVEDGERLTHTAETTVTCRN